MIQKKSCKITILRNNNKIFSDKNKLFSKDIMKYVILLLFLCFIVIVYSVQSYVEMQTYNYSIE